MQVKGSCIYLLSTMRDFDNLLYYAADQCLLSMHIWKSASIILNYETCGKHVLDLKCLIHSSR